MSLYSIVAPVLCHYTVHIVSPFLCHCTVALCSVTIQYSVVPFLCHCTVALCSVTVQYSVPNGDSHSYSCHCTLYSNFRNYAPPLIFTVNMPPLFLRAVFSKFFGWRCLVEGLVSAPAHHQPPPKKLSTPGPKKWQGSQIHLLP